MSKIRRNRRKSIRSRKRSRRNKSKSRKTKLTTKQRCQKQLQNKIRINMREYKSGRYVSPKQAIAVSYSQTKKRHPSCKRVLTKKK